MAQPLDPEVSVLIPAYNSADTLPRALRSVFAQEFRSFEVVVVDDGSTDGLAAALADFPDPRLRCLRHEGNRGEAAARTTAQEAARAPLLAWLDADDEWLSGKLEAQVRLLTARPDLDAVVTDYLVLDRETGRERLVHQRIPPGRAAWLRELLAYCDVGLGSTLMVRRAAALAVGPFDPQMIRHTDWDWLVRFAERHTLGVVPGAPVRVHFGTGHVAAPAAELSARRFLDKHREAYRSLGTAGCRAIARRWREVARYHLQEGALGRGALFLGRSLLAWPLPSPRLVAVLLRLLARRPPRKRAPRSPAPPRRPH